jgi:hypothetical protein
MDQKIVFYTRRQYGRLDAYIQDPSLAEALYTILKRDFNREAGEWAIGWDAMEAFKLLGFTFTQTRDPKAVSKK